MSSIRIAGNIWIQVTVESKDAGDLEPQLAAYAVANQDKSNSISSPHSYIRLQLSRSDTPDAVGLGLLTSSILAQDSWVGLPGSFTLDASFWALDSDRDIQTGGNNSDFHIRKIS